MRIFERPWALWLLVLIAPLAAMEFRAAYLRVKGARSLWGRKGASAGRSGAKALLRVAALACLVVALAGPRLGTLLVREPSAGLDVAIVLDVSRSMLADDGGGPRLERAKALAREALAELPGARFSLVLMKGKATTLCPLSEGREVLEAALESAASESMSAKGTDMGAALDEARRSLRSDTATARAILLLSDGEDLAGAAEGAVARIVKDAVVLMSVGLGSEGGARIPAEGSSGRLNRRMGTSLEALSMRTGGAYAAEEDAAALRRTWNALASKAVRGGTVMKQARVSEAPFILAALLMAFASFAMPERPRPSKARRPGGGEILPVALILLMATGLGSCARARGAALVARAVSLNAGGDDQGSASLLLAAIPHLGREDAAIARYDLASAYLAAGEPGIAADILERAIEEADERDLASLHYNLGCARYAEGRYLEAWNAFRASLKERPGDPMARANLEFAWARVTEERESASIERTEARLGGLGGEARDVFDLVRAAESGVFQSTVSEEDGDALDY